MKEMPIYREVTGRRKLKINEQDKVVFYTNGDESEWVYLGLFRGYSRKGINIYSSLFGSQFVSYKKLKKQEHE